MKKLIVKLGILLAFIFIACSPDSNNKLLPKPDLNKPVSNERDVELNFEPKVDILFVIDNSGSMSDHQIRLAQNIGSFISKITANQFLDYHIGTVLADRWDREAGILFRQTFVTKNTAARDRVLSQILQPGDGGLTGREIFFDTVVDALSEPNLSGANAGFYRDDAFLAIIFLTDTGDQGATYDALGLYDYLLALKANDDTKFTAYGALTDNRTSCSTTSEPFDSDNIRDFIQLVNGQSFLLCSPTYGDDLARIGEDLQSRIELFVPLEQAPVLESIEVKYGNTVIPPDYRRGWSYDSERVGILLGKDIDVSNEPPGAKLKITFIPATID